MARTGRTRRTQPDRARARLLEGRIEEIGALGDGVLRAGDSTVHVPLTAPGDLVRIEARGDRGRLLDLIEESSRRAPAPCAHYGVCGGCALQHVTASFYRDWKRERIVAALRRVGLGDAPVAPLVGTQAASRRRATFAVERIDGRVRLGFNERQSSRIAAIDRCIILDPQLLKALPGLQALAAEFPAREFDLAATLCMNGVDVDIRGENIAEPRGPALHALASQMRGARIARLSVNGDPVLTLAAPTIEFDAIAVSPPPGAFLQASAEGEGALRALVREGTAGAAKIADLFSGCGAFALPLAKAASVAAFDKDQASISALDQAARRAQARGLVNPVRVEARDLFERPLRAGELGDFDAVLFDPPRAGASAQAAEIAKSRVSTIVAVSCNPATFARDGAILSQGGYLLRRVTPVDQFVYSSHLEIVGVFGRK